MSAGGRAGRDPATLAVAAGFDLDSTIANTEHRRHLMPHVMPGSTWDDYAAACPGDTPVGGVIAAMRALWPTHQVHIVSGRSVSAEAATRAWLAEHDVPYDVLHLRGPGEISANGEAKARYLIGLRAAGIEPVVFFDDWAEVAAIISDLARVPVVLVDAGHGEYESGPAAPAAGAPA
jgi:hypothetical protein